jgi:hypothetical protein
MVFGNVTTLTAWAWGSAPVKLTVLRFARIIHPGGIMRISLMSLGDLSPDPITGHAATPAERHQMFVEAAVLADEFGYDGVNVGEHHALRRCGRSSMTTAASPSVLTVSPVTGRSVRCS